MFNSHATPLAHLLRLVVVSSAADAVGSPFPLRVSSAGLLTFTGPGLQDGVIGQLLPHFTIDTENAGRGEVNVKIGGPRGRSTYSQVYRC